MLLPYYWNPRLRPACLLCGNKITNNINGNSHEKYVVHGCNVLSTADFTTQAQEISEISSKDCVRPWLPQVATSQILCQCKSDTTNPIIISSYYCIMSACYLLLITNILSSSVAFQTGSGFRGVMADYTACDNYVAAYSTGPQIGYNTMTAPSKPRISKEYCTPTAYGPSYPFWFLIACFRKYSDIIMYKMLTSI